MREEALILRREGREQGRANLTRWSISNRPSFHRPVFTPTNPDQVSSVASRTRLVIAHARRILELRFGARLYICALSF
ncbi:MAG TPA: hypothetical protein VK955_06025 [Xanthobacteraceae bacterium]|nr:hypothetical protein [Xanthobacteraceae bacterium]